MQQIGDGRHAAVEDDIADFRQSLLLQLENVFQRQVIAGDGANQLKAVFLRENQQCGAGNLALKPLAHRYQNAALALSQQFHRMCWRSDRKPTGW